MSQKDKWVDGRPLARVRRGWVKKKERGEVMVFGHGKVMVWVPMAMAG